MNFPDPGSVPRRPTTRRRFLQRAGLGALALAAAPALAACSDTTVPGGSDPHLAP
ncbi:MAG: twin-arginine translocation signal domain-containing protein, partial [Actinobacteria bacterium]|nr:twin-arginine translocation signal domain-containing protein [Actinomycetota bacterium]